MPTPQDVMAFIESAAGKVGKREIARAFGIKGSERAALKELLAGLVASGQLAGERKRLRAAGKLPTVMVIEITGSDDDGDLVAAPVEWEEGGPRPRILIPPSERASGRDGETPLGIGDRILARLSRLEEPIQGAAFAAEPLKRLPRERRRLVGIFRRHARGGGTIDPVDRRDLKEWPVLAGDEEGAADGDLVRFDIVRRHRSGMPGARVSEVLGNPHDQRRVSLIAVHAHGLRDEFPAAVLAEVEALPALTTHGRLDLTALPLVTIDPVDARDHDDAVHAEPDGDPTNPAGFIVTVAIADVAHYVRPGTRLDREAQLRGNSVYFPDRVVPMLPERISNDLCSLREHEVRPCLAVRMVFDATGDKRTHSFHRALMRSAAKLSYEEAQAAIEGRVSARAAPVLERALKPLWAAYDRLAAARDRRAPLDLDLPERRIEVGPDGRVARIHVPERLAAHRLIEEMMIQANVAAAETLEERRAPVVYRVHGQPGVEKLVALRDFLASLDISLPPGSAPKPEHFNRVLAQARGTPHADLVNEVVLRAQAQAEYATANIGHFGLNLRRYAHFTSPIRRYADLAVHRSLVAALDLGAGGLTAAERTRLADVAREISEAERRAMAAERETADRLIAAYLADRIHAEFAARISGVTRSGLFVRLAETGADGFIPASTISGGEFWRHHEDARALIGDRSGKGYRLGDAVTVRLVEAIPTAGALRFEMLSAPAPVVGTRGRRGPGALRPRRPPPRSRRR